MKKNSIEKVKEGIEFLFEKANVEIEFEVSIVNQYDDADDYQIMKTSVELPLYKLSDELRYDEWEVIFNLGNSEVMYSRIFNGYREFISLLEREAPYSYSFAILHIPICEYKKIGYYGYKHYKEGRQWKAEFKFLTFLDYLIERLFYDYRDTNLIPYGDIIRKAGEKFISEFMFSNMELNLNICNDVNILSALKYEGSDNRGSLLLCKSIDDVIEILDIKFISPIGFNNYKMIRKLLEISIDDVYLIGTPKRVYGFITNDTLRKIQSIEILQIKINGPINWELLEFNVPELETVSVIQCKNSLYQYAEPRFSFDKFSKVITEKFPNANVQILCRIIELAIIQHHGTTVVFSDNAKDEAKRLARSSFLIEPSYTENMIKYLTSIDGAILFDTLGDCHAIGVILDGYISETEDISNGARHNSARRYKRSNPNSVVIVISEDGYVTSLY